MFDVDHMLPLNIKTRDELLQVIRDRRDELNISHLTIDGLAGWADGYASKLLAPTPIKNLGPMSLGALLSALALGIVTVTIAEDPEQAARMVHRWTPRRRRPTSRCVVSPTQTSFDDANMETVKCPKIE